MLSKEQLVEFMTFLRDEIRMPILYSNMDDYADEYIERKNGAKPIVSGSFPPSKYEVRNAENGDECIMAKEYNVRIATFSKGTKSDAILIGKLLGGNDR